MGGGREREMREERNKKTSGRNVGLSEFGVKKNFQILKDQLYA